MAPGRTTEGFCKRGACTTVRMQSLTAVRYWAMYLETNALSRSGLTLQITVCLAHQRKLFHQRSMPSQVIRTTIR